MDIPSSAIEVWKSCCTDRAFAGNPAMVVADEPAAALDVSMQAAVTGLLMDNKRTYRTTLLFISHDLGLVR